MALRTILPLPGQAPAALRHACMSGRTSLSGHFLARTLTLNQTCSQRCVTMTSTLKMPAITRFALPLLVLLLLSGLAVAQTVTRGPYLQSPTPNSVIVKWRTDVATDSVVGYAMVDGTPAAESALSATTEHEVLLSGLVADTLYNYTIGNSTGVLVGGSLTANGDGEHFFTTAPASGSDKPTRVWVIGDSGTKNADAAAVRDAYKAYTGSRGTDVWLMLGDNAYRNGTDTEYQQAVFDMYPQLLRQVPLWSALGNHDGIDIFFNPPGAYPQIFSFPTAGESGGVSSGSEKYYSFDYANIHFITLDSTTNANRAAGSAMWDWLAADLAANTQRWTIAFWHHPHYSKGSHDSDAEVVLQEMRALAMPPLDAAGVDLVLTGHSHSYERSNLIDGHYGASTTLTAPMVLDGGDGSELGDGAYLKPGAAGTPHEGAVHAVVGSSGKTEAGGTLDHPVMERSIEVLGSMVLDVTRYRLDATFIDSVGVVQDEFTIIKNRKLVAIDVDPWSSANEIRPASNNLFPVAVLGAADFDATQVDESTVKLGIGGASNVATPWVFDVAGDAETDLILGFETQATGIFCDDTEVSLVGETVTGDAFIGTDTITTADCIDLGCHP